MIIRLDQMQWLQKLRISFKILLLIALLSPPFLLALDSLEKKLPNNPILHCLGRRELYYHRSHELGPLYKLNRVMIGFMIETADIPLVNGMSNKICNADVLSPAEELLKELLIGKIIFRIEDHYNGEEVLPQELRRREIAVGDMNRKLPRVFLNLMADYESEFPSAHCLEKYMPELKTLRMEFKYLEEEPMTYENLLDRKRIQQIFDKIPMIPSYKQKCDS